MKASYINAIPFSTKEEMYDKLKEHKIPITEIIDGHRQSRTFYYKGFLDGHTEVCTPYGIEKTNNYETLILKINDDFYKINFDYFKEMQNKNFTRNKAED